MPDTRKNHIFRVLDCSNQTAAEHMALEEVLLTACSQGVIPNTIRFLQFRPCVLVGIHQNVELEVNVAYCREQGIEINRRISGGGSIYCGPFELGWELYAPHNTAGIPRKVESMYRLLCGGMVSGLKKMGVNAAYRPVNDIEVNGRKIAGTGGTEDAHAFVFQCSLLVQLDVGKMLKVLRIPREKMEDKAVKSLSQRVTCLQQELGYVPARDTLKSAILAGLAEALECEFYDGQFTAGELALLAQRLPYYQSEAWIFGQASGLINTVDSFSNVKAPGGLIRVQIRLDKSCRWIRQLVISGDFFAYPSRAINDLEAMLKNTTTEETTILASIQHYFANNAVEIPGVTAADFAGAISKAVEKAVAADRPEEAL